MGGSIVVLDVAGRNFRFRAATFFQTFGKNVPATPTARLTFGDRKLGVRQMGWKIRGNGRYFYRSQRVDGRVVTSYVGGATKGKKAEAEAKQERQKQERQRALIQAKQADYMKSMVTPINAVEAAQWLMNAALVASGFYRHDSSEWRVRYGANSRRKQR